MTVDEALEHPYLATYVGLLLSVIAIPRVD